jgi:hypothetical protein
VAVPLAALLDCGPGWRRSGGVWRLGLALGPEQRPLLAALGRQLGARPSSRSGGGGRRVYLWLGPRVGTAPLAAALPHCRSAALVPPPGSWAAPLAAAVGSAVAREMPLQRRRWVLTVALARGQLKLSSGNPFGPSLRLASHRWAADSEVERALLAAAAAALGAAAPADGAGALTLAAAALGPLAEALASYPLPLGGRWPLLPEALALAALAPEDAAAPGRRREFRRRWRQLPDGCAPGRRSRLGGRREKRNPLGHKKLYPPQPTPRRCRKNYL